MQKSSHMQLHASVVSYTSQCEPLCRAKAATAIAIAHSPKGDKLSPGCFEFGGLDAHDYAQLP